jgi:transcriptional repressor NrdR
MSAVICPRCHSSSRVLETRRADDGAALRRRRECPACGHRFTTHERRELPPLFVRKRDGRREPFDRAKLRAGMLRAAYKRPVEASDVESIVDRIEAEADAAGGEIPASRAGDLCLEGLSRVDRISYLQFASVYKQLADVDDMRAELARLGAARQTDSGAASVRGERKHPAAPAGA